MIGAFFFARRAGTFATLLDIHLCHIEPIGVVTGMAVLVVQAAESIQPAIGPRRCKSSPARCRALSPTPPTLATPRIQTSIVTIC